MTNSPNQLSFLPDDYLESKRERRTNAICATLFLVVMIALGGAFKVTEMQMKRVDTEYTAWTQRYEEAARPIQQFRVMQDKQKRMNLQAELTASLLEKVPRSNLLAEITNALPPGTSLIDLVMDCRIRQPAPVNAGKTQFELKQAELDKAGGKAMAPEPRAYDTTLKITGMADNDVQVAAFINSLSTCPLFRDVNMVVSDEFEVKKQKVRRFQLEMTLAPNADAKLLPVRAPRNMTAAMEVK